MSSPELARSESPPTTAVDADDTDELSALMAAKRAKTADLAAMRERVGVEMAAAMDTGVRVNAELAQALGVEVAHCSGSRDSRQSGTGAGRLDRAAV